MHAFSMTDLETGGKFEFYWRGILKLLFFIKDKGKVAQLIYRMSTLLCKTKGRILKAPFPSPSLLIRCIPIYLPL